MVTINPQSDLDVFYVKYKDFEALCRNMEEMQRIIHQLRSRIGMLENREAIDQADIRKKVANFRLK